MKTVAIDGPAGAGKSSISRIVAEDIGFIYVDTGALYRAIGLYALRCDIDLKDSDKVIALLCDIDIEIKFEDGWQKVYLNGEDVSERIHLEDASMASSVVSAIPKVREFLLDLQRKLAQKHDVIMDGRDIGTVVLPNADLKIFLTATPEDRAMRRYEQQKAKGLKEDYEKILKDIIERDYNDSNRKIAPLKAADDAVIVDTTGNERHESIEIIKKIIKDRFSM